jgi:hypothetical protein
MSGVIARRVASLTVVALAVAIPALGADRVRNDLVWNEPDRAVVAFPDRVTVRCGPWASDVRVPAIHVRAGRPGRGPHWELSAVVAGVKRHPVVRFPADFVFDDPKGALLFAAYGDNEVSSAEEEAAGRIRFTRVHCGRRARLAFRVDATLGSELSGQESLAVHGTFRATGAPGSGR